MKKILLAAMLIGMMSGCTDTKTVEIDDCEYLKTYNYGIFVVDCEHKGNCKNPIHKEAKQ